MSHSGKEKQKEVQKVTQIGLLRAKHPGCGLYPYFGPMGVAMIQINGDRGMLSCQVFNLRPLDEEFDRGDGYGVWLAGPEGNQDNLILVGRLQPGDTGQGGGQWEFISDFVEECGLALENFNRVVIAFTKLENLNEQEKVILLEGKLEEPENYFNPQLFGAPGFGGIPEMNRLPDWTGQATNEPGQASLRPLIGLTLDQAGQIKYLVHAIPGRFNPVDQPRQGKSGYVYWYPAACQEEHPGRGYWLVYLEPQTSRVVYPDPLPQYPWNNVQQKNIWDGFPK